MWRRERCWTSRLAVRFTEGYLSGARGGGENVQTPLWQSPCTPRPANRVREGTVVLVNSWVGERARACTDMVSVGSLAAKRGPLKDSM
jgi:hypothetical protein